MQQAAIAITTDQVNGNKETLQSLHLSEGGQVTTLSTYSTGTNLRDRQYDRVDLQVSYQ